MSIFADLNSFIKKRMTIKSSDLTSAIVKDGPYSKLGRSSVRHFPTTALYVALASEYPVCALVRPCRQRKVTIPNAQ